MSAMIGSVLALVGCSFFYWLTPAGLGITPDSTIYLEAAVTLATEGSYSALGTPITHWPPLYPSAVAALLLVVNDPMTAARLLAGLLFAANIGLVYAGIFLSVRRVVPSAVAALLFGVSEPFITLHSLALSEPLFITLVLGCALSLGQYLASQKSKLLVVSSVLLGLSVVTRYAGLAFLPAAWCLVLFAHRRHPKRQLIRALGTCIVLSTLPFAMVVGRNAVVAGSSTNRELAIHAISPSHVRQLAIALHEFAFPLALPEFVAALTLVLMGAAIAVAVVFFTKRSRTRGELQSIAVVPSCSMVFAACYLFFLAGSISFVDAYTPVDHRLLAPMYVLVVVAIVPVLWVLFDEGTTFGRVSLTVLIAILLGVKVGHTVKHVPGIREGGGYNSPAWRSSPSVAYAATQPRQVRIYSNGHDVIRFLTKRESVPLPEKVSPGSLRTNGAFHEELEKVCENVHQRAAIVLYIRTITWRSYLPDETEIVSRCRLETLREMPDGSAYGPRLRN